MKTVAGLIKLLRLKQWLKNVFTLAPLAFAGKIFDIGELMRAAGAFFAFGFVASGMYVFNDILDAEVDKHHPRKRNRPIACGIISKSLAAIYMVALLALGMIIGTYSTENRNLISVLAVYLALNLFYTIKGKQMHIVDAFCIAAGFVLRVLAGAYAIGVAPTGWIIVTTFFLALFLGFGKRRGELVSLAENSSNHRQTLSEYRIPLLDQIIVSAGTIAIISYALYTLDQNVIHKFHTASLVYTAPFVAYGIYRYMHLLLLDGEGDPTELLTKDRAIALDILLWIIVTGAIIYMRL